MYILFDELIFKMSYAHLLKVYSKQKLQACLPVERTRYPEDFDFT
jgi:hypothetical protein